jgi:hypothetical protein
MAAERNDDDIAAALHGLSAGKHDSTADQSGSVHGEHVDLAPAAPAAKVPPTQPAKRPVAPPARPAAPLPPRPQPQAPAPGPRPAGPRPAAPARPAVPGAPATYEQEFFDDGDHTVLDDLPATPLDYRGPRPAPTRPRKPPMFKTLGFRRTVIPILLSTGVMMLVMFAARGVVDEASTLARMPAWTFLMLLTMGIVLIALAVLNMMLVRAELSKRNAKG